MPEYVVTIRVEARNMAEAVSPFLWDDSGEPNTGLYISLEVEHG